MEDFLSNSVKIAILLNPFAVLSTFLALTNNRTSREKSLIVLQTSSAVLLGGMVLLFSGDIIFRLLDIDLNLFKVGGGIILLICSISLVWGEKKTIDSTNVDTSIAVVPLAIPMALGPGTAAGLLVIGSEVVGNAFGNIVNILSLISGIIVLAIILSIGIFSEKLLNSTIISVITKLTGLFLSAIAAKMILEGIKLFLL